MRLCIYFYVRVLCVCAYVRWYSVDSRATSPWGPRVECIPSSQFLVVRADKIGQPVCRGLCPSVVEGMKSGEPGTCVSFAQHTTSTFTPMMVVELVRSIGWSCHALSTENLTLDISHQIIFYHENENFTYANFAKSPMPEVGGSCASLVIQTSEICGSFEWCYGPNEPNISCHYLWSTYCPGVAASLPLQHRLCLQCWNIFCCCQHSGSLKAKT